MRWIVVLLVLILLGAGAYWGLDLDLHAGEAPGPLSIDEAARNTADAAFESIPARARSTPRAGLPAEDAAAERSRPSPDESSPPTLEARPRSAGVDLRCVDVVRRPIAGIRVGRADGSGDQVESDQDGRVAWRASSDLELPRSLALVAEGGGHARRDFVVELEPGMVVDLGELVLRRGGAIAGRVETALGEALPHVVVHVLPADAFEQDVVQARLEGPNGRFQPHAETLTDAAGSFLVDGIPAGWTRLWAQGAETNRWTYSEPVEVRPDEIVDGVLLILEPLSDEDRIEGIVLRPNGEPHPDSRVHYRYSAGGRSGSGSVSVDESGRFMRRTPFRGSYQLHASDRSGELADSLVIEAEPGDHRVELRLRDPIVVEVLVQDEEERPVDAFDVRLTSEDREQTFLAAGPKSPAQMPPGVKRFAAPPLAFRVVVDAQGFEISEQGPFPAEAPPTRLVFTLVRLPGVRGVVTENGKPYSGAVVEAFAVIGDDDSLTVNGFVSRSEPWSEAKDTSDEEGRFVLGLRESGRYTLRATAKGFAPAEIGPLELDAREGADGFHLELTEGGSLRVRLLTPEGTDVGQLIVGISRGDGFPVTRQPGPDETVVFERLTPGPWYVRWNQDLLRPGSVTASRSSTEGSARQELPESCVVFEGRETVFELDLGEARIMPFEGTLTIDSRPPAGWKAQLELRTGAAINPVRAAIRPDGRFTLSFAEAGSYVLHLTGRSGDGPQLEVLEELELAHEPTRWSLDLLTGRIEGRVKDGARARISYHGQDDEGRTVRLAGPVGADGRFELPKVPAGRGSLYVSLLGAPPRSREIRVEPGSTYRVELE